jgi:hypothetical protein
MLQSQEAGNSLHTALISAPDSSSLVMMSSSRSTSSASDIREVWSLKMCRLVLVSGRGNSDDQLLPDLRGWKLTNLSVYTSRSNKSWVKGFNLLISEI